MGRSEALQILFSEVREQCTPRAWSQAVELTRSAEFSIEQELNDEITLVVAGAKRVVSPRVTINLADGIWSCDCGADDDPCVHIAGALIALRSGKELRGVAGAASRLSHIGYRFISTSGMLVLERSIVSVDKEEPLRGALYQLVAGVESGRIPNTGLSPTREDLAIDALLAGRKNFDARVASELVPKLAQVRDVTLDGKPIRVRPTLESFQLVLTDVANGFRIAPRRPDDCTALFSNGVFIVQGEIGAYEFPEVPASLREYASLQGTLVLFSESERLLTQILPMLRDQLEVEITSTRLPQLVSVSPRVVLELIAPSDDVLTVIPRLVYGNPSIAEVREGRLQPLSKNSFPCRDEEEERRLTRTLQIELQLRPNLPVNFKGKEAVAFRARLIGWEIAGEGSETFNVQGELLPQVALSDERIVVRFSLPDGRTVRGDAKAVFDAWHHQESLVPLLGGGVARVPVDWLSRYGPRFEALLNAQQALGSRSYLVTEAARIAEESLAACADSLAEMRQRLTTQTADSLFLPSDLTSVLRHYQEEGVRWLQMLKSSKMGALLADDMGLGKTLQAMCAFDGKTLVVAPTSVLFTWHEQLTRFRPSLRVSLYYGSARQIDQSADVVLTSYALLRLDLAALSAIFWDTVLLDEAQNIKNPQSQVAQAAYQLKAQWRIALSGTPVENRLEELWSQFQFLNPGLLGTFASFQDLFARPINRGESAAQSELRKIVAPFILRRLKREVAPELPPKTEVVLYCELGPEEQEIYQALLLSGRKEVLTLLESGGALFNALELLLRVRQACAHPALIEDRYRSVASAKCDVLIQALLNSKAAGHRALIFSQWTALLDLLEPMLTAADYSYLRLDGSTRNRDQVVRDFQGSDGPNGMLISLKAGGVGLTLTAADHIYIVDPWWNPAVEDQAADRAHRIGQENPVLVHRLVAKDTIEERILALQNQKRAVAKALFSDDVAKALTREEILALFS